MSVYRNGAFDDHELVAFGNDRASGLRAIVAVHDTRLGPAVGGCRMFPYASEANALFDVLRLSRGMTYKSALAGLPFGGGKSVMIGDPCKDKNPELLAAMGKFIDSLNGRYIAAEDSGTGSGDIKAMSAHTSHVRRLKEAAEDLGNPSASTARGVYLGIRTAVRQHFGAPLKRGLRVAVQGLGQVGFRLAGLLKEAGADVFGTDINKDDLERAQAVHGVRAVAPDAILALDADVLAPCAMGAVLTSESIDGLRVAIVAGAANNQLADETLADRLQDRGILYCPDFVINAGGIIDVYHRGSGSQRATIERRVQRIEKTLGEVLDCSNQTGRSPHSVAEGMAEEVLNRQVDRRLLA